MRLHSTLHPRKAQHTIPRRQGGPHCHSSWINRQKIFILFREETPGDHQRIHEKSAKVHEYRIDGDSSPTASRQSRRSGGQKQIRSGFDQTSSSGERMGNETTSRTASGKSEVAIYAPQPGKILIEIQNDPDIQWPLKMRSDPYKQDNKMFYCFPNEQGHDTD